MSMYQNICTGTPDNVLGIRVESVTQNSISISWTKLLRTDKNGVNIKYIVHYYRDENWKSGRHTALELRTTSVKVSVYKPNATISFKVAAMNENGIGPFSPLYTVDLAPPG